MRYTMKKTTMLLLAAFSGLAVIQGATAAGSSGMMASCKGIPQGSYGIVAFATGEERAAGCSSSECPKDIIALNLKLGSDNRSIWERGLNENTNGLVRQYLKKGSDFTHVTANRLKDIMEKLNSRPRKSLNYSMPCNILFQI